MHVVFDPQAFRIENHGGVSRYIVSLARALQAQGVEAHAVAPIHHNTHLREFPAISQYTNYLPRPVVHRRIDNMLSRLLTPLALRMARPDILHATFYKDLDNGGAKIRVLTVHDMIHERFVSWHPGDPQLEMKARAVAAADHIICISRSTQRDLCELLNVPIERTTVVYHGGSRLKLTTPPAGGRRPYVLYVGQRHRHKNFGVLLDAFGESAALRQGFDLVSFGGSPFSPEELERARRAGIEPESLVRKTGDDTVLAAHYAGASAMVYPSLYEGFGNPLIEAMALDCPVIAADTSCLPEIAGDGALYFKSDSPAQLAARLEQVLGDEALRRDLLERGRRREASFSWERCAIETRAAYATALAAR